MSIVLKSVKVFFISKRLILNVFKNTLINEYTFFYHVLVLHLDDLQIKQNCSAYLEKLFNSWFNRFYYQKHLYHILQIKLQQVFVFLVHLFFVLFVHLIYHKLATFAECSDDTILNPFYYILQ